MTIEELEAQSSDFDGVNSSSPELREQLAEMSLNPTQEPTHENVHFNYHEPVEVEKQNKPPVLFNFMWFQIKIVNSMVHNYLNL